MKYKSSRSRGFSHHLLLPIIAILLVGGIGSYVMLRSSSALSATKDCTAKTFGRYKNNPAYAKYDNLKPCVRAIQSKVGAGVDGIYGNNTQAKVKAWQKKYNTTHSRKLTVDGVVGSKTWDAMKIKPKYQSATKRSCNAKSGYEWKSNKCQKKEPKASSTSAPLTKQQLCKRTGGIWVGALTKCVDVGDKCTYDEYKATGGTLTKINQAGYVFNSSGKCRNK